MDNVYNKSTDEVLKDFDTTEKGLTYKDAEKRREKYGFNELDEGQKKSTFMVFLEQFKDFLVIILLTAAAISGLLGEYKSTIVILIVITINAILGTVQNIKAEKSLDSLKKLSAPAVRVIRGGKRVEIPSRELVPGDIMYLEAGDMVSADGRIYESFNLQINEGSLTGESESIIKTEEDIQDKDIPIGDRKNMVFSGSFVTYGRGIVVVTGIGMNTEIGKIANLLETAGKKKTPLQESLDDFGKKLAVGVLIICAVVFGINVFRGNGVVSSFMFAVSLAVAAIPEALSSIVTIVLSIGTQKMAKSNAIVRKLYAVESLGSVSVICSDKTGTLTQNRMKVRKLYCNGELYDYDKLDMKDDTILKVVASGLLCSDAIMNADKSLGDPTEIALVDLGDLYKKDEEAYRIDHPRLHEIPFDSDRKLMSTVNDIHGETYMITKGATDVLLRRIDRIEVFGEIRAITQEDKDAIKKANMELSESALRVLAFGYKPFDRDKVPNLEDEKDLIFTGLIAMMDPPREQSLPAVEACKRAGIRPVMITGDHKVTASAIAKMVGILEEGGEAIDGRELDKMSEDELRGRVKEISVYARVSPEHKIRIVKAWQDNGSMVAMTGDGVNDAPALKQADIGVAMGITGTEVAKDAASMVLTDDNFSTIVSAISSGRSIYENIKNSIGFLLSGNAAGILAVLYTALLGLPNPFTPLQLLFINLITDSLPAIAIGMEPYREDIMTRGPRDVKEPILNKDFIMKLVGEGIIIAIVTLTAYYIGLSQSAMKAGTMAFSVLCLSRLFHGLNSRSNHSLVKAGVFTNVYVWYAILIGAFFLQLILMQGFLMDVFGNAPLTLSEYGTIYGLALVPVLIIQLYRTIRG